MLEDVVNKEIEKATNEMLGKRKMKHAPAPLANPEPTFLKKVAGVFFEEDAKTVVDGVKKDVVFPMIKNLAYEIVVGGLERAFFGRSKRSSGYRDYSSSSTRTRMASGTNYSRSSGASQVPKEEPPRRISLDALVYNDRPAAQDLADIINGEIYDHGSLSIAELYEIITDENEVPAIEYTDNYRGWTREDSAVVKSYGRGWRVVLPRPKQLPSSGM